MLLEDGEVIELAAGAVRGESPAVGGDDRGRTTAEPIFARVGRNQWGQNGPLLVGEIRGKGGESRRQGRISRT